MPSKSRVWIFWSSSGGNEGYEVLWQVLRVRVEHTLVQSRLLLRFPIERDLYYCGFYWNSLFRKRSF